MQIHYFIVAVETMGNSSHREDIIRDEIQSNLESVSRDLGLTSEPIVISSPDLGRSVKQMYDFAKDLTAHGIGWLS